MLNRVILYVGNFDLPQNNAAGKRVYGNALIFQKLGYNVVLVGKSKNEDVANGKALLCGENIWFYSFPDYKVKCSVKYINFLNKLIESNKYKIISIIRYGSPTSAWFDYKLNQYAQRKKMYIIADVVDWLNPGGRNIFFNIIKKIDTYLEKAVFNKNVHGIIAISTYLKNYYESNKIPIIIIPPIVEKHERNEAQNEDIVIGYMGSPFRIGQIVKTSAEVKDRVDLAVQVVTMIIGEDHKVKFHIFGLTKEDYLTAYPKHQQLLQKMDENIVFHGKRPMTETQEFIRHCDYTILLRDRNRATMAGFPSKIVESISCGTPVITTDTSDLKKYIKDGENGFFVDISDIRKLQRQLLDIIQGDNYRLQKMKDNCYETFKFTPDNYMKDMKKLLDIVCGDIK